MLYAKLPNVARIAVAHPGQLRLIFRSQRKNDRVDAAKLAKLLYLDQVPQVHVVRGGGIRRRRVARNSGRRESEHRSQGVAKRKSAKAFSVDPLPQPR